MRGARHVPPRSLDLASMVSVQVLSRTVLVVGIQTIRFDAMRSVHLSS